MEGSGTRATPPLAGLSPFLLFPREQWAELGAPGLSAADAERVRRAAPRIPSEEVRHVYLPLSRLLELQVGAARGLYAATRDLLGFGAAEVPYVIGIAGSVAAGKSTVAALLRALIAGWPERPRVELVTTDGFLHPNRVLEARGLMDRKGFPESYDLERLLGFLSAVKAGEPEVSAPTYSHAAYDVVPDRPQVVSSPDVLIIEGLNILEAGLPVAPDGPLVFVSDYFDFSIYVHAEEAAIRAWYRERFLRLRDGARDDEAAYFHRFAALPDEEAIALADRVWDEIDHPNLKDHIEPTRLRARLILEKGADHAVHTIQLRKV
jgi:type I pantothenate kinase